MDLREAEVRECERARCAHERRLKLLIGNAKEFSPAIKIFNRPFERRVLGSTVNANRHSCTLEKRQGKEGAEGRGRALGLALLCLDVL